MHIEEIDQLHDENIEAVNEAPKGEKLKKVWVIAFPVLKILAKSWLVPKKWRNVISILIDEIEHLTTAGN